MGRSAGVSSGSVVELPEQRWRESLDLFVAALHMPPTDDDRWRSMSRLYSPGRTLGVLGDGAELGGAGELLGTVSSFDGGISVPGGAVVPMMAMTASGVRADRTRRGILTAMMEAQLSSSYLRGEVVSVCRVSEAAIYGRFGYGRATRTHEFTVDCARARMDESAPSAGAVRLLSTEERSHENLSQLIPTLYRQIGLRRPGAFTRPDPWWDCWGPFADPGNPPAVAVHVGPDGIDGYAIWTVDYQGEEIAAAHRTLNLYELIGGDPTVASSLWRFVLELDLVERIRAVGRPLDDPVSLLLENRRACRVCDVFDEAWLRLVDVSAALQARTWTARGEVEPVVVEVADRVLPQNCGSYRIGADGAWPTRARADLRCDVGTLATAYLGDVPPSRLAAAGGFEVRDDTALARADLLFAVDQPPWFGAFF